MKEIKILFLLVLTSLSVYAQSDIEVKMVNSYQGIEPAAQGVQSINDTLTVRVLTGCSTAPRTYQSPSIGFITGTNKVNTSQVAQLLNRDSSNVQVYSVLVLITNKIKGPPTIDDFSVFIHNVTDSLTPGNLQISASDTKLFSSLTAGNTFNRFTFGAPVFVNSKPFFASMSVHNNADTISVASSGPNCGDGTALFYDSNNQTHGWRKFRNVYNVAGQPLDIVLYIFAEVDNKELGLNNRLISRNGLEFYPNPAQDFATIKYEMSNEKVISLRIQDNSGNLIMEKRFLNNADQTLRLELGDLPNGVYTYQLVGRKQQLNGVFVK